MPENNTDSKPKPCLKYLDDFATCSRAPWLCGDGQANTPRLQDTRTLTGTHVHPRLLCRILCSVLVILRLWRRPARLHEEAQTRQSVHCQAHSSWLRSAPFVSVVSCVRCLGVRLLCPFAWGCACKARGGA